VTYTVSSGKKLSPHEVTIEVIAEQESHRSPDTTGANGFGKET
jgi:hypothetical protein